MKQVIIYVDAQQHLPEQEGGESYWTATAIMMPIGEFVYGNIVSAIIDTYYSADQMQAIINNYLIGEKQEAFEAMQQCRRDAKTLAHEIVGEMTNGYYGEAGAAGRGRGADCGTG